MSLLLLLQIANLSKAMNLTRSLVFMQIVIMMVVVVAVSFESLLEMLLLCCLILSFD